MIIAYSLPRYFMFIRSTRLFIVKEILGNTEKIRTLNSGLILPHLFIANSNDTKINESLGNFILIKFKEKNYGH